MTVPTISAILGDGRSGELAAWSLEFIKEDALTELLTNSVGITNKAWG
ncbi:hypothetical protein H6S82_19190 [Planktothrix sp. FACHB-1355]|uniref:Uncharacterized protein n=1 Tax=Aerosakkonema funiforme FACHB-1375 TaxID=2949571 RepID=A0A926VG00_9CYAN|nr:MULTISPECIES: hypothetical protein [Oscillatoriales]MBD2183281.1 hypothetical protein [Aerosakkonema funiforme FACHB-1375]MBD3560959.1 hypothetical protein [Planktothrix sp. FACHB-1355]